MTTTVTKQVNWDTVVPRILHLQPCSLNDKIAGCIVVKEMVKCLLTR